MSIGRRKLWWDFSLPSCWSETQNPLKTSISMGEFLSNERAGSDLIIWCVGSTSLVSLSCFLSGNSRCFPYAVFISEVIAGQQLGVVNRHLMVLYDGQFCLQVAFFPSALRLFPIDQSLSDSPRFAFGSWHDSTRPKGEFNFHHSQIVNTCFVHLTWQQNLN
jgi:hypothetical protein